MSVGIVLFSWFLRRRFSWLRRTRDSASFMSIFVGTCETTDSLIRFEFIEFLKSDCRLRLFSALRNWRSLIYGLVTLGFLSLVMAFLSESCFFLR